MLISISKAAKIMGMESCTLRNDHTIGLKAYRKSPNAHRRYDLDEVMAMAEKLKQAGLIK